MQEKIGVGALKDIEVIYKGDVYDLACLLLKMHDAKNKGTNTRSRRTVNGLASTYSMIMTDISRSTILEIFRQHNLPLGATVKYDKDVA